MSMGTGALKVGRGAEHFRQRHGGIHGNPVSGKHPCRQLPSQLAPSHWSQSRGKIPTWCPYLPKRFETLKGREGWELESAKILSNTGKMISQDQLESKQSDTSKVRVPSPCDQPTPCHVRFGDNPLTPVRHKPATSIGSILTLPKLHLATLSFFYLKSLYQTWNKNKI